MFFWHNWHRVADPCTADDWPWVNSIMGPRGLDRWMYIEHSYYFKHDRDATLFRLMWAKADYIQHISSVGLG